MGETANCRDRKWTVWAGALALVLAAGGCSSVSGMLPSSLTSSSSSNAADGAQASAGTAAATGTTITDASDFDCPQIAVRTGTSTMQIGDKTGNEPDSPLALKYQGTIANTARECRFAAGVVTMKIGVEGRIIVGPAGGPGQVDVPIRIAVVHEGPQPKVVLSKLARLAVTVQENTTGSTFTHIDQEISYPMPTPAGAIDSYVVYVGFDPNAEPPKKKPRPRSSRPRR